MLKISIVDSGAQRRLVLEGAVVPAHASRPEDCLVESLRGKAGTEDCSRIQKCYLHQRRGRGGSVGLDESGSPILVATGAKQARSRATHKKDQTAGIGLHFSVSPDERAWFKSSRRCSEHEMLNSG